MESKIQPLTSAIKPGWVVTIDGNNVPVSNMLTIENKRLGVLLSYGKNPGGSYDSIGFHENGGGGSVVIPFTTMNGELYTGTISQLRPFQSDEPVDNVVRGFMDPGKDHFQTAKAELVEEAGLSLPIIDLGGGGNPNSTFFETWGEGEGIHFWGCYVDPQLLEKGDAVYVFSSGVVKPIEGDKSAEAILGSKFVPWTADAGLGDMMTLSAITRLLKYLKKVRTMSVIFEDFDPEIARFISLRENSPAIASALLNLLEMSKNAKE